MNSKAGYNLREPTIADEFARVNDEYPSSIEAIVGAPVCRSRPELFREQICGRQG